MVQDVSDVFRLIEQRRFDIFGWSRLHYSLRGSARLRFSTMAQIQLLLHRNGYGIRDVNLIASMPAIGLPAVRCAQTTEYLVTNGCDFSNEALKSKEEKMTDRRPFNPNVTVPKPGGGEQPRSRNNDGQVRDKRSDAGKPKKK